jgi:hypothetical protein
MANFAEQIDKIMTKYQKRIDDIARATVIGIAGDMIENAAVGQWDKWSAMAKSKRPSPPYQAGEFKGSFDYSFGSVDASYTPTIDKTGHSSLSKITAEVNAHPAAGRHFIHHNAPYAGVVNTGVHPSIPKWRLIHPNRARIVDIAMMNSPIIIKKIIARKSR